MEHVFETFHASLWDVQISFVCMLSFHMFSTLLMEKFHLCRILHFVSSSFWIKDVHGTLTV